MKLQKLIEELVEVSNDHGGDLDVFGPDGGAIDAIEVDDEGVSLLVD